MRDCRDTGELPVSHGSRRMSSIRLILRGQRHRRERITSMEKLCEIRPYLDGDYNVWLIGALVNLPPEQQIILDASEPDGIISAQRLKDLCGQWSKEKESCDIPPRDVVAQDLQLSSSSSESTMQEVNKKKTRVVSLSGNENISEGGNNGIIGLDHVSNVAVANVRFLSSPLQDPGPSKDLQEVVRRISSRPRPRGKESYSCKLNQRKLGKRRAPKKTYAYVFRVSSNCDSSCQNIGLGYGSNKLNRGSVSSLISNIECEGAQIWHLGAKREVCCNREGGEKRKQHTSLANGLLASQGISHISSYFANNTDDNDTRLDCDTRNNAIDVSRYQSCGFSDANAYRNMLYCANFAFVYNRESIGNSSEQWQPCSLGPLTEYKYGRARFESHFSSWQLKNTPSVTSCSLKFLKALIALLQVY